MSNNFQALKIHVQANFSSKRVCRCLHMHKASERKINEVNKVSKLCFGAPEMFSASQNYLSVSAPPKSGRFDAFILQIHSQTSEIYKVYFGYIKASAASIRGLSQIHSLYTQVLCFE